eukprot:6488868-Lingulodinium_polyedra.AAC.1
MHLVKINERRYQVFPTITVQSDGRAIAGQFSAMFGQCSGNALAMLWQRSGNARAMLGQCSGD